MSKSHEQGPPGWERTNGSGCENGFYVCHFRCSLLSVSLLLWSPTGTNAKKTDAIDERERPGRDRRTAVAPATAVAGLPAARCALLRRSLLVDRVRFSRFHSPRETARRLFWIRNPKGAGASRRSNSLFCSAHDKRLHYRSAHLHRNLRREAPRIKTKYRISLPVSFTFQLNRKDLIKEHPSNNTCPPCPPSPHFCKKRWCF